MTTMKCLAGSELVPIEDSATNSIRNSRSVQNKWQDGLKKYVGLKDRLDSMRLVKGGQDKHRNITFTIILRVSRLFNMEGVLDSASIDLQDRSTEMIVKKNRCVFEKNDLISLMVYPVLGEKISGTVINAVIKEAHLAMIKKKNCSAVMKECVPAPRRF